MTSMGTPEGGLRDWLVTATAGCALAACLAGIVRPPATLPKPPTSPTPTEQRTSWVRLAPPAATSEATAGSPTAPTRPEAPPAAPATLPAEGDLPSLPALPTLPSERRAEPSARPSEPSTAQAAAQGAPGAGTGPVRLTKGELGGSQPWPEYPAAALRRGESGTVTVRLSVDAAGDVTEARVDASSGWRSLDEAATGTIRRRWSFPPGQPRDYLVDIRFQIL